MRATEALFLADPRNNLEPEDKHRITHLSLDKKLRTGETQRDVVKKARAENRRSVESLFS